MYPMAGQQYPYRRRQKLVNPDYQYRYMRRLFVITAAAVIGAAATAYGILWILLFRSPVVSQDEVIVAMVAIGLTMLVELAIAAPLIVTLGLFQSHKVAGPLVRIKRALQDIADGDLSTRITLRKYDELHDLADAINQMVEQLQRRAS